MTAQADPPRVALTGFSDGTAEVELGGELDVLAVPTLSAAVDRVLDHRPSRLIFDLRAVTFLDIGAIRMLAGAALNLPGRTRPVIRGPSTIIRSLFELSSFNAAFEFEELPHRPEGMRKMATSKQKRAAKQNVQKAQRTAAKKKTISHMPSSTRTALGKQGAAVAQRKRTGGSSPKTRAELYKIAQQRDLPGRSKMGRDELARKLGEN